MKWIKSQLISISFFTLKFIGFIILALPIALIQMWSADFLPNEISIVILIVSGLLGFYLLSSVWIFIDDKKAEFIKNQITKEKENNESTSISESNYKKKLEFIFNLKNKLLGKRLEKFKEKENYNKNSRLKLLNWILKRKKGVTLSIILIPVLKLFTHYFLYTSGRMIGWLRTAGNDGNGSGRSYKNYDFGYHIDNLFIREIWLFIPVTIVFLALVWFFNDKKEEIKAKKNENEANKSQETENKDEKTEDKKLDITSIIDELTKLGELKEKGLLTEDEFEEQKKKLLKQ